MTEDRKMSTEVNVPDSDESGSDMNIPASASSDFEFNFDLSNWSPDNPRGLNLLGLQPTGYGGSLELQELPPGQASSVGKIKRPKSRLHCRRGAVVLQKNPLGRDVQGMVNSRNFKRRIRSLFDFLQIFLW